MEDTLIRFPHLAEVLERMGKDIQDNYKEELLSHNRKATGTLVDSIHYETSINGNEYAIDLYLEDYFKYVEYDTKPHFPPHMPIFEWVKAKPLLPTEGKVPNHRNGMPYTQEEQQDKIAWAVQNKIAKEGTKGTHDLEKTIDAVVAAYEPEIEKALDEDILGSMDEIMLGIWS